MLLPGDASSMEPVTGHFRNGGSGPAYERVQAALRAAHGHGLAYCACRDDVQSRSGRALQIRHLSTDFILARNANTGPAHADACPWFVEDHRNTGRGAYVEGVVAQDDHGTYRVRLKTALRKPEKKKRTEPRSEAPAVRDRAPGRTQRAMTQRGFLDFIWDITGLNIWAPSLATSRSVGVVLNAAASAASRVCVGRSSLKGKVERCVALDDRRFPPSFRKWAFNGERAMVFGLVRAYDGERLSCHYAEDSEVELRLDAVVRAHVETSFSRELSALKAPSAAVVALCTCDFSWRDATAGDRYAQGDIVDVALLAVDATTFIPVASSYELVYTRHLVASGRAFRKPLRYDASEDDVFPDFVLSDVTREFPIEVWGMDHASYRARRDAKAAYFDASCGRGGWASWDAVNRQPFPSLPPAVIAGTDGVDVAAGAGE